MSNNAALTIRTDTKTKKTIADFAASVGLSTSAFATAILLQAVREQRVLLTPTLEPTPYLEKVMREADSDIKANKNISKAYDNIDDFFSDLDKG
jgi:antitoxin component of RelBE/YafQ-DinJ toxin-antitoxin module